MPGTRVLAALVSFGAATLRLGVLALAAHSLDPVTAAAARCLVVGMPPVRRHWHPPARGGAPEGTMVTAGGPARLVDVLV